MRHRRQTHRLGRNFSKRRALLENLVISLLLHQQIQTTLQKAKAAKRLADRIITLGKEDSLNSRRQAFRALQDHQLVAKLFKEIAPRFKSRKGGYTRILQLQRRKGDGAQLALLELTEKEIKIKETPKKKDKKSKEVSKEKPSRTETPKAKHEPEVKEAHSESKPHFEKEEHPKHPETKMHPPKGGFFKNLGRFFKNKGGG
jgi:large subunit ribosomal protein L17